MAAVFKNLYYRHIKFPAEFKNANGISAIGNIYHNSLIVKSVRKGERIRTTLLRVKERIISNETEIGKLEQSPMIENDQFHSLRRNIKWQTFLFWTLLTAEIGLNIFTARIIIPAFELRGILWDLIRLAIAIAVTITATWACDKFLEMIFLSKSNKAKGRLIKLIVYLMIFIFAEVVIAYFGLVRAHDLEGGNQSITTAMTILAMIVPIVAGAIWWNINEQYDEYSNRKNYEKRLVSREYLASKSKSLQESEITDFKKLSNHYWYTFQSIKTYKENFNARKNINEELSDLHLKDFEQFNKTAFTRYNQKLTIEA